MTTGVQGHLFIVHGDLTKLSCDGILVPCDDNGCVSRWWFDMFEQRPTTDREWESLPEDAKLRASRKGPIQHELVDTVSSGGDVGALVENVHAGLAALAGNLGGAASAGRATPLLAMPMPGTGNGGLDDRRGAVVQALVPRLVQSARELGVDVALVVRDRRDYAAVQSAREPVNVDLDADLESEADRLGALAAEDQLSIFVGAGVSVPLGLPSWSGLVNELRRRAQLEAIPDDADEARLKVSAGEAKQVLGERFDAVLGEALGVQRHALGHALLAGTRVRQNVTTNFDEAMEIAMTTPHGEDLKVLTGQWAASNAPWLLKLHGTAGHQQGVVLTEDDYARHRVDGQPLYGLVQGLLLTSHLMFVGFSLTDSNYLHLAKPVADIYARAGAGERPVATALGLKSLASQEHVLDPAFKHVSFGRETRGAKAAARTLEIFLDRLAWKAARSREGAHGYLMDERYADLVRDQGAEQLVQALLKLESAAIRMHGSAADRVLEHLEEFGARRQ